MKPSFVRKEAFSIFPFYMIALTDESLRQFGNLELLAKQAVEGFIIGLHKSPYHGFSVEFAEHRLYNAGDNIKNIDWKVYARTDKMYLKRFEEETNLRCQLVIDCSSSMYYPLDKDINATNKIKFSALCAASIMNLMRKQRDAVGLSLFDESISEQTKARSSSIHHKLILTHLEQTLNQPKENKRTAAAKSLHQIAESIHKRSLVVIFSDMLENAGENDDIFAALQHLRHAKHDVILFHVYDKKSELDFNFENRPYEFIDMETGQKVKLRPGQVKSYYLDKFREHREALKLKCGQYNIDIVEADINEGFETVLINYLRKRSRMY